MALRRPKSERMATQTQMHQEIWMRIRLYRTADGAARRPYLLLMLAAQLFFC
jgi:hypothetical protein